MKTFWFFKFQVEQKVTANASPSGWGNFNILNVLILICFVGTAPFKNFSRCRKFIYCLSLPSSYPLSFSNVVIPSKLELNAWRICLLTSIRSSTSWKWMSTKCWREMLNCQNLILEQVGKGAWSVIICARLNLFTGQVFRNSCFSVKHNQENFLNFVEKSILDNLKSTIPCFHDSL